MQKKGNKYCVCLQITFICDWYFNSLLAIVVCIRHMNIIIGVWLLLLSVAL